MPGSSWSNLLSMHDGYMVRMSAPCLPRPASPASVSPRDFASRLPGIRIHSRPKYRQCHFLRLWQQAELVAASINTRHRQHQYYSNSHIILNLVFNSRSAVVPKSILSFSLDHLNYHVGPQRRRVSYPLCQRVRKWRNSVL